MPSPRASARCICPVCDRETGCYLPTQPSYGDTFHVREHKNNGVRCDGGQKIVDPLPGTVKKGL